MSWHKVLASTANFELSKSKRWLVATTVESRQVPIQGKICSGSIVAPDLHLEQTTETPTYDTKRLTSTFTSLIAFQPYCITKMGHAAGLRAGTRYGQSSSALNIEEEVE